MPDRLVRSDLSSGVATITLDSPHNRNALSAQLQAELSGALAEAFGDDAVRVVVLTHSGRVFCSGMDLKQAGGVQDLPAILHALWTAPKPVLARVAGPARAGGVGLVAACDIAIAAEPASFAFSEVRIGVVPATISVVVLPRMLARPAHELFLTGETFAARRAVEVGLLNRAVPGGELDAEVARYASMLALGAPGALAATKALLRGPDIGPELRTMAELSARHFDSEEGREGIRAFGQKRPPVWAPAGDDGPP